VEQEEEKISNVLLKKIDTLQKERAHILRTVEEEEEYITNTLQKKLDQACFSHLHMDRFLKIQ
jgi:coiled-coil domain-containing protein 6